MYLFTERLHHCFHLMWLLVCRLRDIADVKQNTEEVWLCVVCAGVWGGGIYTVHGRIYEGRSWGEGGGGYDGSKHKEGKCEAKQVQRVEYVGEGVCEGRDVNRTGCEGWWCEGWRCEEWWWKGEVWRVMVWRVMVEGWWCEGCGVKGDGMKEEVVR